MDERKLKDLAWKIAEALEGYPHLMSGRVLGEEERKVIYRVLKKELA